MNISTFIKKHRPNGTEARKEFANDLRDVINDERSRFLQMQRDGAFIEDGDADDPSAYMDRIPTSVEQTVTLRFDPASDSMQILAWMEEWLEGYGVEIVDLEGEDNG